MLLSCELTGNDAEVAMFTIKNDLVCPQGQSTSVNHTRC